MKGTGPVSYRVSHLGAEKARAYDDDLWDPRAAKGLDWLVEQRLLADVLRSRVPPGPRSTADFACGTGRVLEFLSRHYDSPVGIDISPDMLALARDRCPRATVVLGDVTTTPALAPGPFDLITAFRFFLNAEPDLRSAALEWMRGALRPDGIVVANFHLNPVSLRGAYLRLRMKSAHETANDDAARTLAGCLWHTASPSTRFSGTASSRSGGMAGTCWHQPPGAPSRLPWLGPTSSGPSPAASCWWLGLRRPDSAI